MGDRTIRGDITLIVYHSDIENPLQIVGFLSSWKIYLDQLSNPSNTPPNLDELLQKLSNEQTSQLYELLNEIKKT